ncbi:uncharacterized protein LAJ45_06351 [Morchella importuna]|nr:uncharacterized protein LAJ45_06351 [Morchella importuna]KAH8149720.1 hypothetical protein LAJ45_06351 [Morchella importuna]
MVSTSSSSTTSDDATSPPRCLLLGLEGSGKTTFVNRIKTGEYIDTEPTSDFLVEEVVVNKKGETITFIEVGGTNRRGIRLQFLKAMPGQAISILFFIDVTSSPEALQKAFEELVYVITYTQERACSIHYLGVVLNKQDLLNSPPTSLSGRTRKKSLSWGTKKPVQQKQPRVDLDLERYVAMEVIEGEENERMDSQSEIVKWIQKETRDAIEKHKLAQPEELDFYSELLYTGPDGKGISMKRGDGVQEVYHRLVQGMKAGRERPSLSVLEKIAEEKL